MPLEAPGPGRAFTLRLILFFAFAIPALFLGVLAGKAIHEVVGHGLVAWMVGGKFTGFKICLFDVSHAYAHPAGGAPTWHQVLISAGGIVSNVVLGLLCLLVVLRRRQDSFLRFGFTILAAVSLLEAASYSFWGAYLPASQGDPGTVLKLLNREWLRWTVLAVSSASLVGFTVMFNALVFQFLETWLGEGGGEGYALYSIGRNRRDEGGHPPSTRSLLAEEREGDLTLDSYFPGN